MNDHLTTRVTLEEDGLHLTLSGPRTGTIRLRYASQELALAVSEMLAAARQRCWEAREDELETDRPASEGPSRATLKALAEVIQITDMAISHAEGVVVERSARPGALRSVSLSNDDSSRPPTR